MKVTASKKFCKVRLKMFPTAISDREKLCMIPHRNSNTRYLKRGDNGGLFETKVISGERELRLLLFEFKLIIIHTYSSTYIYTRPCWAIQPHTCKDAICNI